MEAFKKSGENSKKKKVKEMKNNTKQKDTFERFVFSK